MIAVVLRPEMRPLSTSAGVPPAPELEEAATVMNSCSFRACGGQNFSLGGCSCWCRPPCDITETIDAPRPRKRSGPRGPLPGTTDTTGYCRSFRTSEGSCCACESIDTPDCIRIWSVLNVDVAWAKL